MNSFDSGAQARLSDVARKVRQISVQRWGSEKAIEIVGRSSAIQASLSRAERFASFQEPVLLLGESGVGKESFAQAIHLLGAKRGSFVTANCPQFEDANLTVSELFGHVKGSFTGANVDRKGCFELADGGVIFLDEIGDLPVTAQAVLLRALSSGKFRALGSAVDKNVDARVIAATNRHLNRLVAADEFRHDLLYRLRSFELEIPPLRDRGEDWLVLLEHYLEKMVGRYRQCKRFSEDSLKLLEGYSWPGNVRDVIRIVTNGFALADGSVIEPGHFRDCLQDAEVRSKDPTKDLVQRLASGDGTFWTLVHDPFLGRDLNRQQVIRVVDEGLQRSGGSYKDFLRLINLPQGHYQRLMDFLRHHRLKPERSRDPSIG